VEVVHAAERLQAHRTSISYDAIAIALRKLGLIVWLSPFQNNTNLNIPKRSYWMLHVTCADCIPQKYAPKLQPSMWNFSFGKGSFSIPCFPGLFCLVGFFVGI
jgi:hypothetical protein